MSYYKAREQDTAPFLVFDYVAASLDELKRLRLDQDPLVVSESRLTDPQDAEYISYEFGICHVRIQNNALVARPIAEIEAAESQLERATRAEATKQNLKDAELETFTFLAHTFAMDRAAEKFYNVLFDAPTGANYRVASLEDENYVLKGSEIAAFKTAYYSKIMSVYNAFIEA